MDLVDVLAQALKLEKDGRTFYERMAAESEDETVQAMFKQLAADEVDHYNYIKRQYDALQAGQGWSAIPEMELVESIDAVSLVFPADVEALEEAPADFNEEDALIFGLTVENKSFQLYHNSAQQAQDSEAQRLFRQLAGAEQVHFDVLMQRYESRFGYAR